MIKKIFFIAILLTITVGFSQEKSIGKLFASPNPFVNKTIIVFQSSKNQTVVFSVKSILGNTVYKKEISIKKGINKIPFFKNNLHTGMYIYKIRNQKETVAKRLVIK